MMMSECSGTGARCAVVIPVFNRHEHVDEALASVRAQTQPPATIVIVDDGSDRPETIEHLDRLGEQPGVRLVRTPNQGPGGAFNTGRAHIDTEYALFLGDDDIVEPEYIAEAVAVLDTEPSIGVVYCRAVLFGDAEGTRPWGLPSYDPRTIVLDNMVHSCAVLRLSDYDRVGGFDETLRHGREDHDLWLRMTSAGIGFHRLDKVLFRYRQSPGSVNRKFGMDRSQMASTYGRIARNSPELYLENMEVLWEEIFRLRAVERRYERHYGRFDRAARSMRGRLAAAARGLWERVR